MEATKTKLVDYRVKNGVAVFTLTDPPANTYTHEMMRELDECILQARFDENVHVIVLTRRRREVLLRRREHQHAEEPRIRRSNTSSACTRTRR